MPICVVVLKEIQDATELALKLRNSSIEAIKLQLIQPNSSKGQNNNQTSIEVRPDKPAFPSVDIDTVKLLSPKLSRQLRQKTMAFWLMPFGFIAGLTFTKMTGLKTFTNLGFDPIAEPLIGSFLGMGSGLIGSYIASASVNPDTNNDIEILRKLNSKGLWLLLLETPLEIELPWVIIQDSAHDQIIRLNNI